MPTHTVDLHRLYAAVDRKRADQGISWRQLARDLDLAPSRFTALAHGGRIGLDTLATLVAWLKADAASFVVPLAPDARRSPAASPLSKGRSLSERLKPDA